MNGFHIAEYYKKIPAGHLSMIATCTYECLYVFSMTGTISYTQISMTGTNSCVWFSMTGTTSCTQCPGGSECITASSAPVACGDGFVAAAGSTACTACTPGELNVNRASRVLISFVAWSNRTLHVYYPVLSNFMYRSSNFVTCLMHSFVTFKARVTDNATLHMGRTRAH